MTGEATKNIPDSSREKYPEIPREDMSGMRDRIMHVYFKIDYNLVWDTIQNRIPKLKPLIKKFSKI